MKFTTKSFLSASLISVLSTNVFADQMKVATTFTVIADIVSQVAGDTAEVVSITKPGAEIHGYQSTPQDLVRASDADLILWNGLNLELWFEQFIRTLGDKPSATVSEGITPISISGGEYDGLPNPHAWMGLENALIYVDNISQILGEHDPENAEVYLANADRYKTELRATIEPLKDKLATLPEDQRWLVSCEGAFSYLAADLGLKELYIWPNNADQVGTPRQVQAVIEGIRSHDIPAVFCESTVSNKPAEQVARETGAVFGGVLYVDSLSEADGPVPTYLDLLEVTVSTIADGLTGAVKSQ